VSRIHLHIDRVVLRGFDSTDRHVSRELVRSLEAELGRMMADPAVRASFTQSDAQKRAFSVLRVGQVPMGQDVAGARKMGVQIARSIGKSIKKGGLK
jgi:hypothetical protein